MQVRKCVIFIYIAICFRVRRQYIILFLFQGRNWKIFIIFIFKCCSYGYQGKEIQVLMDQSVPPVVPFQFLFLMLLCFILHERQDSEPQIFERYTHEGRTSLVQYKEAMGGAVKLRRETKFRRYLRVSFAQPLRQMTASPVLMMLKKKAKQTNPQMLSICVQIESILDCVADFKHL